MGGKNDQVVSLPEECGHPGLICVEFAAEQRTWASIARKQNQLNKSIKQKKWVLFPTLNSTSQYWKKCDGEGSRRQSRTTHTKQWFWNVKSMDCIGSAIRKVLFVKTWIHICRKSIHFDSWCANKTPNFENCIYVVGVGQ